MFLITQPDFNTIALSVILLLILYYVSDFKRKVKDFYNKPTALHYLNTTARIKALDYAPNALITIDIQGNIVCWNSGASIIFGHKEKDVVGKSLDIIIPDRYKERHHAGMERLRLTGKSEIIGKVIEMHGVDKKGNEFPISLTIWQWNEGTNILYTGIIRDISIEKQEEAKIKKIITMHEHGEQIDGSGVFSWDVLNDIIHASEGFKRIFGTDKNDIASSYFLNRIYYEDLKKVEEAIKGAFVDKKGYCTQYRIVNNNGVLVHVEVNAEVYFNENNELVNITGTIHKL